VEVISFESDPNHSSIQSTYKPSEKMAQQIPQMTENSVQLAQSNAQRDFLWKLVKGKTVLMYHLCNGNHSPR
jgi:hypothetical protein